MSNGKKILLITPPLLQPNCPYPATTYLTGYLKRTGIDAEQRDLSVDLLNSVFRSDFLSKVFECYSDCGDDNLVRIYSLRRSYIKTIDLVMKFLRGEDDTIANLICAPDFLPQASRFHYIEDIEAGYGSSGTVDCARYLATLYLEDLTDFINAVISPYFGISRYAESLALSVPDFSPLDTALNEPLNLIEQEMTGILEDYITSIKPAVIGFTIPFPGNLLSALRCGQYIKANYPGIKVILGGGYPSTELRHLTDTTVFDYTDYIILDDGELPLQRIMNGDDPVRTFTRDGKKVVYSGSDSENISHSDRGCPDYSGLEVKKYFSLVETVNPMHRLWGDGFWNKIIAAHGCYWAKCAFCDTSLDYICRYDAVSAATIVDWMEQIMAQTGKSGFHFVDEAIPPKLMKEIALELLRRELTVSWWGNVRFEPYFTADMCQLLAASGCIAVSGGIEAASDRLLKLMNKGVSIEELTIVLRNFYYSGIMVHGYLMYGFPTQTAQEIIDSLEIVRQLFLADLLTSAFWHRFAMTRHSLAGKKSAEYGVRIKGDVIHKFANNEVQFAENRNYDINIAGVGLKTALYNYIRKEGFDKPVNKWFTHKYPVTAVENTEITDHLIKPDNSRLYNENTRIIYLGNLPSVTDSGLIFYANSTEKNVKVEDDEKQFFMEIFELSSDLESIITLKKISEVYSKYSDQPFSYLYHSKRWDIMRGFGLLQI
ncbi:MAG: radical SAM protein [Rikenellaceae bacterium]|nr:radical SAM protein [Rikenellaceae bacterium]